MPWIREASNSWNSFFRAFAGLVYPEKCGLCGRCGMPPICADCANEMSSREGPWALTDTLSVASVFDYDQRAAHAVRRLKYDRATSLAAGMSAQLVEVADRLGMLEVDCVIPVPIHYRRRCSRGFNQSELLCSAFPQQKVRFDLLKRIRATRPQVGLNRDQRSKNLQGAFRGSPLVSGKTVLLVDDVLTGGHTMRECALELSRHGAAHVAGIVFCVDGWQRHAPSVT